MIGDAAQHIGEPGLRIDAVEFGGGNQGIDRGCALATAIGTGEEPCAAPEGKRPVILPMSGRRSRSNIAGTPFMAAVSGVSVASSG
jgi:hypothetical protein